MTKRSVSMALLSLLWIPIAAPAVPAPFSFVQTDATTGSGTVSVNAFISTAAGQISFAPAAAPSASVIQKDPNLVGGAIPAGMVGYVNVVDATGTSGAPNGMYLGWSGSVLVSQADGLGNTFAFNVPLVLRQNDAYSYTIAVRDDNSGVGGTNDAVSAGSVQAIAGFIGNNGNGHRHTGNAATYVAGPDTFNITASGGLGSNAAGDNLGIGPALRANIGGATLFIDQIALNVTLQSDPVTVNGSSTFSQFNAASGPMLVDIGAAGQRVEPGAIQVTGPANNTNGFNLLTGFISTADGILGVTIDNISQTGAAVGGLDWRDRGNSTNGAQPLVQLGEDLVKNNGGIIRLTLDNLAAGEYQITSYHQDLFADQTDEIHIFVDTGSGYVEQSATGSTTTGAAINVNALTTASVMASSATFSFVTDGLSPVLIVFDGRFGNNFSQNALSGFSIQAVVSVPEPATLSLLALGALGVTRRRARRA